MSDMDEKTVVNLLKEEAKVKRFQDELAIMLMEKGWTREEAEAAMKKVFSGIDP